MLISTNRFDKSNSKYECDMCKKKMSSIDRIGVSIAQNYENTKKRWDLCKKCYKKLERAVERYYLNRKEKRKNDT